MAKKVIVSPRAERDLEKITGYLFENWGSKVVDDFIKRYLECFDILSKNPELYPIARKGKQVKRLCSNQAQRCLF